jgi:hypothetical protein
VVEGVQYKAIGLVLVKEQLDAHGRGRLQNWIGEQDIDQIGDELNRSRIGGMPLGDVVANRGGEIHGLTQPEAVMGDARDSGVRTRWVKATGGVTLGRCISSTSTPARAHCAVRRAFACAAFGSCFEMRGASTFASSVDGLGR